MSAMNLFTNPPASWREAIGKLNAAWKAGRFPQAVLLDGPAGLGKKKLAMDLAAFLSCENGDARPCGHCFACKTAVDPGAADQWLLPLVMENRERKIHDKVAEATSELLNDIIPAPFALDTLSPTALIGVEEVRHLRARLGLKASGVRVYIIAEADTMNDNAANALLKTLEEVPPQTYFILTTSRGNSMLQTIMSRCMPLRLPPLKSDEIAAMLVQLGHPSPSPDMLGMAMGSVGKALQSIECNLPEAQARAVEFLGHCLDRQWSNAFAGVASWFEKDVDAALFFLDVLAIVVEDMLRRESGAPVRFPALVTTDQDFHLGSEAVSRILAHVSNTVRRLEDRKGSVPVAMQTLALQIGEP